jgi:hypothetical protein
VDRQGDDVGSPEAPPLTLTEVAFCVCGPKALYLVQMIHSVKTYAVRPAGLLLVALFALSLIWCPDAACRTGAGDDQCTSLICALLANTGGPRQVQSSNLSTECVCVCHMPTISGWVPDAGYHLTAHDLRFESPPSIPASPSRSIDQPPRL